MRPVKQRKEPPCFDGRVRKRGQEFVKTHPDVPVGKWPPYWRDISRELWDAYDGIDAYYSFYFEYIMGVQVDHFLPKSRCPHLAYEWSNYRLASSGANGHKHTTVNILDPFTMKPHSFFINFLSGEIYPNPNYAKSYVLKCNQTIKALKLDDQSLNYARRQRFYELCIGAVSLEHLKKISPFVWDEVCRQGLDRFVEAHRRQMAFTEFAEKVLSGIL